MSTRAIYTFKGFGETHHVYKHHDGYPTGAADAFNLTLQNAWGLPRYEPNEFAAAFVAANKPDAGGVRLVRRRAEYADVDFGYTVEPDKTVLGLLRLTITAPDFWEGRKETKLWSGLLVDFIANADAIESECYA